MLPSSDARSSPPGPPEGRPAGDRSPLPPRAIRLARPSSRNGRLGAEPDRPAQHRRPSSRARLHIGLPQRSCTVDRETCCTSPYRGHLLRVQTKPASSRSATAEKAPPPHPTPERKPHARPAAPIPRSSASTNASPHLAPLAPKNRALSPPTSPVTSSQRACLLIFSPTNQNTPVRTPPKSPNPT